MIMTLCKDDENELAIYIYNNVDGWWWQQSGGLNTISSQNYSFKHLTRV